MNHVKNKSRLETYDDSKQNATPSDLRSPPIEMNFSSRPPVVRHQLVHHFPTPTATSGQLTNTHNPRYFERTGELLLLAIIIGLWLSAIAVFLHRWKSIRIVRAPETRMASYRPKNLEAIKVVTKHRDSVIYKNLPENMSRTLEARQKRLNRMSTVPNIKLGEQLQHLLPQPQSLLFTPLLLQHRMKEPPVYCFGRPQSLPQLQEFLQQQLMQQLHLLRQTQHSNLQPVLSPQAEEDEQPQQPLLSLGENTEFASSTKNISHLSQLSSYDLRARVQQQQQPTKCQALISAECNDRQQMASTEYEQQQQQKQAIITHTSNLNASSREHFQWKDSSRGDHCSSVECGASAASITTSIITTATSASSNRSTDVALESNFVGVSNVEPDQSNLSPETELQYSKKIKTSEAKLNSFSNQLFRV